ncbi:hypothetical protein THAR02_00505 [Trichoderma harzianum]|uniref:Uncharacterized protein n=1 Tax=Trichoderma harzianum TaxID=5544 RepID=A0A0F9Y5V6_TRIHA|nr:hypothetical protein THAR02_00505 [Trichoderma harzianum]
MAPKITSQDAGARVPLPGQIISVMLSLAATTKKLSALSMSAQRVLVIKAWNRLPPVVWLVFAIYVDSYLFVIATAVLQHSLGVNSSYGICEAAIFLCLVCYVTTKVMSMFSDLQFIYLFLAEKAWIIRGATTPRLKSILYLVNSLGMLTIYIAVVILNFVFRITDMRSGECIIGMRSAAMIPLISFDTVINVYLTIMFLIPLKKLYSYTNMARTRANIRLRMVAFRTFCGAVCTLVSSIVNLSVLMALNVLFSAIVIQWVTSRDNAGTMSSSSSDEARRSRDLGSVMNRISTPSELHETPSSTLADISLVPTRRRSRGADDVDPHDHDPPDTSAAKVISKPASAVMVTTTIESETRPRSYNFNKQTKESSKACGCGCLMYRRSCLADDNFFSPQTKITAGGSHFLEDFGQKVDICYC